MSLKELLLYYASNVESWGDGPILITINRSRLRIECPGLEKMDRTLRLVGCFERNQIPLYQDSRCYTRSDLLGEPVASILYVKLSQGDLNGAFRLAYNVGYEVARLHESLHRCSVQADICNRIIEERRSLAVKAGLSPDLVDGFLPVNSCKYLSDSGIAGHGDLHLNQILLYKDKYYFIDFSGEPGTVTNPPVEYDLSTLIRSLDYMAHIVSRIYGNYSEFYNLLLYAFLKGYSSIRALPAWETIEAYCRARTLYEYYYEVSRKTQLEWIPLATIRKAINGETCIGGL